MEITKFTFLFFLFSIFVVSEAFSQVNQNTKDYYLTLNKPGAKKRIRFYIGDELKFKLKDESSIRTATITAIDSNSITINGVAQIPLQEFKMIQMKKNGIRKTRVIGTRAGLIFMALGGANTLLKINGSDAMMYGGGISLVTVQLLRLFEKRNYRLNSYRYLRAVPHWEGLDLEKRRSY